MPSAGHRGRTAGTLECKIMKCNYGRVEFGGNAVLKGILLFLLAGLATTTFARTWNAKTDWGATGNGKTDDYRAIQRGVAAMASGDTVVFPTPGSYYMGST